MLRAVSAQAQTQNGAATPTDFPSIRVGVLIFADYTVQQQPHITDGDGNAARLSQFEIARGYINVTGSLSRTIAFRLTPDIVRDTGAGSALGGGYVYRLKYAYAQWNLDRHLPAGSYARFGAQPSPWVDMVDTVYRYRFQGATFEDREGYLSSADTGATLHATLPGSYGDAHAGFFNGESYQHPEVNDQKSFQVRGSLRPLPGHAVLRGLRLTGFYVHDAYVRAAVRRRSITAVTFEHPHVHAGFDYLRAADQTSASRPVLHALGWTAFVTPISGRGWEGLLRIDHLVPDRSVLDQTKRRTIAGAAYWFPHQGTVAAALMLDLERVSYANIATPHREEQRLAVHSLISF